MADLPETTDLVYQDWVSYMGTASPYAFGNEDEDDPNTGKKLDDGSVAWYRVSFREAAARRANLNGVVGTRRFERTGFLAVQCFAPINAGDAAAMTMAEAARTYFEDRRLAGNNEIIYLSGTIRPQPHDGRWNIVLLEVEVEFTQFK